MDLLSTNACNEIDKASDEIYTLSSKIWKLAEPGGLEEKSCKLLVKFLRKRAFNVTTNFMGKPNAFSAEFGQMRRGTSRRVSVLLVCQYDAIKHNGHIFGKNLVVAATVAAAIGIKDAILSNHCHKLGKVTLIGSPNTRRGTLLEMMQCDAFRGFDICLTAVPGPRTEFFSQCLATKLMKATYRDKPQDMCGNDECMPGAEELMSPQDAAVMALTNVMLVQEHLQSPWNEVKSVISRAGTNLDEPVEESATVLKLTAGNAVNFQVMEKRIMPCLQAAGQAGGCGMHITYGTKKYHNIITCPTMIRLLRENAYKCGLLDTPLKSKEMLPPIDVASLSRLMPTLRPMFYIGTDFEIGSKSFKNYCCSPQAHANAMSMAKALTMTAIEFMRTPKLLETTKKELNIEKQLVKKLPFEPFPTEQTRRTYLLPKNVPADCVKGWSKR